MWLHSGIEQQNDFGLILTIVFGILWSSWGKMLEKFKIENVVIKTSTGKGGMGSVSV